MPVDSGRRARLIRSFMGVASLRLLSIPLSLIGSALVARWLGPDVFGQYAFILAMVAIVSLPLAAGVPQLLTREIAKSVHQEMWGRFRGLVRAGLFWVSGVFLLICLAYQAGVFFLPSDASIHRWDMVPIALALVLMSGLNAIRNGVLRGLKAPVHASLPEMIIQPICFLIFLTLFHFIGEIDKQNALLSHLFSLVIGLCIATIFVILKRPDKVSDARPEYDALVWLKALLPFSLLYAITTVNINIGTVLLGLMAEDADVAAMRVAGKGAQFVALPLQLVNLVIAPYVVEAWRNRDHARLQALSTQSARGAFLLALPVALAFLLFGGGIIGLIFGQDYVAIATDPLKILVMGQLVNVFFGSVGIMLSMSGYETYTLRGQALALVSSVGLSVLLIPTYGAVGCAIGISLSYLIWNSFLAFAVFTKLRIKPSVIGTKMVNRVQN